MAGYGLITGKRFSTFLHHQLSALRGGKGKRQGESRGEEKLQLKAALSSSGSGRPLLPASSPLISFTSLN